MARDKINLTIPTNDETKSVAVAEIEPKAITATNGTEIVGAFGCKDHSLHITVKNTASAAKKLTVKAGAYDNAVLGDKTVSIGAGKTAVLLIMNPSRFQQKDGAVLIDYETGFTGEIYAAGRHVGLQA